ncbi:MFS transporter [Eremococcus coleocola]|uniref:MFS transporter n=1 Tax=Eremococcus coleocola TaxID=88132 RepID=UPI00040F841C|nr:MFS transporter [Eremococcus coleocola]
MSETKQWRVIPAVIMTAVMSFGGILVETSMNVTFPLLMSQFNLLASQVQWVTTAYLLAVSIVVPSSAYLVRNFSIRNLFITANLLFLSGLVIDSFAQSFIILLLGRILQGFATGLALPLMFHIILTKVPQDKRGLMMGVGSMTTSFAPAIGPTYGGILTEMLDWHAIFWLLLPLLVLSLAGGLWAIPQEPVGRGEVFNWPAFIGLAAFLVTSLLAIEQNLWYQWMLAFLAAFAFYQSNRNNPLINLNLFSKGHYLVFLWGALTYQALLLGMSFIIPNYLQLGRGLSTTQAGNFMFLGPIVLSLVLPLAGRLYDSLGPKKPILAGLTLSLFALLIFVIYYHQLPIWSLLVVHVMMMLGIALSLSNIMTQSYGQIEDNLEADANTLMNLGQQYMGAISTALVSKLLSLGISQNPEFGAVLGAGWGIILMFLLVLSAYILIIIVFRSNTI